MKDWKAPVRRPPKTDDRTTINLPRIVSAMWATSADDYQTWIKYGLALKNESPDLFVVWEQWSKTSDKSANCDLRAKWDSLDPNGRITIGSILHREKTGIKFHALDDYMAHDFQADYWVPGILTKNQPMIAGGAPKTFKTSLIMNMCLAIAAGGTFLGHRCAQGSVVFVSGESGDAANQSIIRRQLPTLGGTPENFFLTSQIPRFDQPLAAWEHALAELGADILVVDPLYLAMKGSDAGNVFEMGQQLKNIADVASRLNVTLILVHHCTKSAAREHSPLTLTDLSWAGSAEFARQWFLLSHRKPYRDGQAQLFLNAGGSAGHSSLLHLDINEGVHPDRIWQVDVRTSGEVNRDREEEQYQYLVEQIRAKVTEPMCKTPIRDAVGFKDGPFRRFLPRLLEDGVLIECGKYRNNPQYKVIPTT